MPEVSIIVPVYKVEKVLHYCVESILNQSFTDFELILVDDGSPDNSGTICDEYANKDTRIIVIHKENGGVSSARNAGIDISKGKYITFIDSDDKVDKLYLELLIDLYNNHIQLAICGFNWIRNDKIERNSSFSSNYIDLLTRERVMDIQSKNLISSPWCKLYLLDIIRDNNIYFPIDLSLGEDMIFNFEYLNYVNDIAIVNKPLYDYVMDNGQSLLRTYRTDLFEINSRVNGEIYELISGWNLPESQWNLFYNKVYYDYENSMRNNFSRQNELSFFSKIKLNREIIKSKNFSALLELCTVKMHPLYYLAYRLHSYSIIYFLNKIIEKLRG